MLIASLLPEIFNLSIVSLAGVEAQFGTGVEAIRRSRERYDLRYG